MARPQRFRPSTDDWKTAHWPYTMPRPDVHEGGASLWEAWEQAVRETTHAFAPTQPSQAAPLAESARLPPAPPDLSTLRPLTAEAVMTAARYNNRVCPLPGPWSALYATLGGRRCEGLPPPPVEAALWAGLSPLHKRLHFRGTIVWAARHWRLKPLALFMSGLVESDWLHMGES